MANSIKVPKKIIEINLLPDEYRKKAKEEKSAFQPFYLLYGVPVIFAILFIVHILLAMVGVVRFSEYAALMQAWKGLQTKSAALEEFKKSNALVNADARLIDRMLSERRNWAEKLEKLGSLLPAGIWFNDMTITASDFVLQCSVVSLQKDEMAQINKFIGRLKKEACFQEDFSNFELSSFKKRVVGGYDIRDFVLIGRMK